MATMVVRLCVLVCQLVTLPDLLTIPGDVSQFRLQPAKVYRVDIEPVGELVITAGEGANSVCVVPKPGTTAVCRAIEGFLIPDEFQVGVNFRVEHEATKPTLRFAVNFGQGRIAAYVFFDGVLQTAEEEYRRSLAVPH